MQTGPGEVCFTLSVVLFILTRYPASFEWDTDDYNFPMDHKTFIGLISLVDPPRKGVAFAIRKCQTAGIKVGNNEHVTL
jgi:magnesium-transporting ATPase (P-type)